MISGVAAQHSDGMTVERPSFRRRGYGSPNLSFVPGITKLPKSLRTGITATFYDAYQSVFDTVSNLCTDPKGIPTKEAVFDASRFTAYAYYTRGGRAEYALEAVLGFAQDQSPIGDGEFETYADEIKGWTELPKCVNDLEFGIVRVMLGLPKDAPPDGISDGDAEMDDEDEDDM